MPDWYSSMRINMRAGAVIAEALPVSTGGSSGSGTSPVIRAERANGPKAPKSTSDPASRVRKAVGVSWTSGYTGYTPHDPPNFAPMIQELVHNLNYGNGVMRS